MAKSPVYQRLHDLRESERQVPRFTMTWLAETMGVDRTAIYRWLNGDWPIPEKRRAEIASLLDMPVDDVRPGEREVAAA
jgi:transcriptional regulator with XRE-family HTH domain